MRLWRRLRYFLGASLVRLETRGAVGFTILISSRSMLLPSKNRRGFARPLFSSAKRLLRRSYTEPATVVKGRLFSDNAVQELAIQLQLGLCGLSGLEKWNGWNI